MILKIDLSKSFDRVNWFYLRLLLTHIGFPFIFIKWIMSYITDVPYSVLINGSASPLFHVERGLRQGCPLSSLFFLLVMESISIFVHEEHRNGRLKGIKVTNFVFLTHFFFMDDVLIFLSGSLGDLTTLHQVMGVFQKATKMVLNESKSTLFALRCAQNELQSHSGNSPLSLTISKKLLNSDSLWTKVVTSKYITLSNPVDWIRQDHRTNGNISNIWKVVIKARGLIRNGLTWRIQSGSQVRLGEDPWEGCGNAHKLPQELRLHLADQGISHLSHIADNERSSLAQQAWKSGLALNIPLQWQQQWRLFITALMEPHIRITEGEDELIWAFAKNGNYAPKIRYLVLMEPLKPPDSETRWNLIWKLKAATRTKLLLWSILNNKVPTRANLMKRSFVGPFWCHLCRSNNEDT
eukprot:PITA_29778